MRRSCSSDRRTSCRFTACRSGRRGSWETPFGQVPVDRDAGGGDRGRVVRDHRAIRRRTAREHSLEMQLPFVAHLLPGVPIVPLVMGHQTRETAVALGRRARATPSRARGGRCAARGQQRSLALRGCAYRRGLDGVVTAPRRGARCRRADARARARAASRVRRRADGRRPPRRAAPWRHARARVLRYADSGDVSGDKSSVVGYMAAAIW